MVKYAETLIYIEGNIWKPTQPRIRFDLEKLNDPTVMSAFRATIGGRFAPLATLVDEDADLDSMVTHFNKAVTRFEIIVTFEPLGIFYAVFTVVLRRMGSII